MAIANVVLNTKTYTYSQDQNGVILWRDVSGGVPSGFPTLQMSLSSPAKADLPYVLKLKLRIPVVATEASECTCAGDVLRWEEGNVTVQLPQTGTTAERLDFSLQMKDLMANALVLAAEQSLVRPG